MDLYCYHHNDTVLREGLGDITRTGFFALVHKHISDPPEETEAHEFLLAYEESSLLGLLYPHPSEPRMIDDPPLISIIGEVSNEHYRAIRDAIGDVSYVRLIAEADQPALSDYVIGRLHEKRRVLEDTVGNGFLTPAHTQVHFYYAGDFER